MSSSNELKFDERLKIVKLENGFTIYMYKNVEPPERVSMRLVVTRGSLNENEDERGIAHFIEHMAFNGTTNFPSGKMIEYFQHLGMAFGSDTNAHTSFSETVYKIDMPSNAADITEKGLLLLRDYASEILFAKESIESERGVILAEKVARDSANYRLFTTFWNSIFKGTNLVDRFPIGTEEVISNAPREVFLKFYKENYTPETISVVVVGDFDESQILAQAKKHFASMEKNTPRQDWQSDLKFGKSPSNFSDLAIRAELVEFIDKELQSASMRISALSESKFKGDSWDARAHSMKLELANYILSRRFARLSADDDSPITDSNSFYSTEMANYSAYLTTLQVNAPIGNLEKASELLFEEFRKVLDFGFTESELKEAVSYLINQLENEVAINPTRPTAQVANIMASAVGSKLVITSPEDDLEFARKVLKDFSVKECSEIYKEQFENAKILIFLSDVKKIEFSPLQIFEEVANKEIQAYADVALKEFAYSDIKNYEGSFAIYEREDLEITQLKFENNVRANFKKTEFEADTVLVRISFGEGFSGLEKHQAPFAALSQFLLEGGLKAHSYDEITSIFAGNEISINFSIDEESFILSGKSSTKDLKEQLLLLRAFLNEAAFDKKILPRIKKRVEEKYIRSQTTAEGVFDSKVVNWFVKGDSRFGLPNRDAVMRVGAADIRNWLAPILENSYMEISLVGDFDSEKAQKLVADIFGTLRVRDEFRKELSEEQKVTLQEKGSAKTFDFESEKSKAISTVSWQSYPMKEITKARIAHILASILDDRMRIKIREQDGIVYSPFAYNIPSKTYDYGFIHAGSVAEKQYCDKVISLIEECANEILEEITEDEFIRAKLPLMRQIEISKRKNAYWINVVTALSQAYPERLDWASTMIQGYEAIILEDVKNLAAEILNNKDAYKIKILPLSQEKSVE